MLTRQKKEVQVVATPKDDSREKLFKEQRMRDLFLLIENLALQEEATIKLIIDCLYDVGMINLVNKKIKHKSANKIVKFFIKYPKPFAKYVAWLWVKDKVPQKLTNWLQRKIS